jgi:hypothetical protein
MRIQKGEFEGELLYQGNIIPFAAIRSELGLSVSFDTSENRYVNLPSDYELFKALEEIVYGKSSD